MVNFHRENVRDSTKQIAKYRQHHFPKCSQLKTINKYDQTNYNTTHFIGIELLCNCAFLQQEVHVCCWLECDANLCEKNITNLEELADISTNFYHPSLLPFSDDRKTVKSNLFVGSFRPFVETQRNATAVFVWHVVLATITQQKM